MKKKVLFVATVLRMHVLVFHLPYMRWFQEQGYEVHLCCRNDTPDPVESVPCCDRYFEMPFSRSPFARENLTVYRQLKALIEQEGYTLIHCNTPVGGMLGRLAARRARKCGTKVLYTAHGFHFFTGAPLKNWMLFYPVERFLSRMTDLLITINGEDYARAKRFHAKQTALVSGVGVDLTRFDAPVERESLRGQLGLTTDTPVVICVGEHSARKNHETVLRAVAPHAGVHVLFCGVGDRLPQLEALAAQLHMTERTHFLGFRKDIPALLAVSDVFMFPSLHEGLPVSQMEAMAAGLPCLVSNVRGNADLIRNGEGGYLRQPFDAQGFSEDLGRLLADERLRAQMGERNRAEMKKYSLDAVLSQMAQLYQSQLN